MLSFCSSFSILNFYLAVCQILSCVHVGGSWFLTYWVFSQSYNLLVWTWLRHCFLPSLSFAKCFFIAFSWGRDSRRDFKTRVFVHSEDWDPCVKIMIPELLHLDTSSNKSLKITFICEFETIFLYSVQIIIFHFQSNLQVNS